jgi:hypothetical protein
MVKRARFAFTTGFPFSRRMVTLSSRQLGGLGIETPGFASPPRDGFALDDCSSGGTDASHVARYEGSTGSPMTRPYGCPRPFGGSAQMHRLGSRPKNGRPPALPPALPTAFDRGMVRRALDQMRQRWPASMTRAELASVIRARRARRA